VEEIAGDEVRDQADQNRSDRGRDPLVVAPSSAPMRTRTSAVLGTRTRGTRKARRAVVVQHATTSVTDRIASLTRRAQVVSGTTIATTSDASSSTSTSA